MAAETKRRPTPPSNPTGKRRAVQAPAVALPVTKRSQRTSLAPAKPTPSTPSPAPPPSDTLRRGFGHPRRVVPSSPPTGAESGPPPKYGMVNVVTVSDGFGSLRRVTVYGEIVGPFAILQWPHGEPGGAPYALVHVRNGYRVLSAETVALARAAADSLLALPVSWSFRDPSHPASWPLNVRRTIQAITDIALGRLSPLT